MLELIQNKQELIQNKHWGKSNDFECITFWILSILKLKTFVKTSNNFCMHLKNLKLFPYYIH